MSNRAGLEPDIAPMLCHQRLFSTVFCFEPSCVFFHIINVSFAELCLNMLIYRQFNEIGFDTGSEARREARAKSRGGRAQEEPSAARMCRVQ